MGSMGRGSRLVILLVVPRSIVVGAPGTTVSTAVSTTVTTKATVTTFFVVVTAVRVGTRGDLVDDLFATGLTLCALLGLLLLDGQLVTGLGGTKGVGLGLLVVCGGGSACGLGRSLGRDGLEVQLGPLTARGPGGKPRVVVKPRGSAVPAATSSAAPTVAIPVSATTAVSAAKPSAVTVASSAVSAVSSPSSASSAVVVTRGRGAGCAAPVVRLHRLAVLVPATVLVADLCQVDLERTAHVVLAREAHGRHKILTVVKLDIPKALDPISLAVPGERNRNRLGPGSLEKASKVLLLRVVVKVPHIHLEGRLVRAVVRVDKVPEPVSVVVPSTPSTVAPTPVAPKPTTVASAVASTPVVVSSTVASTVAATAVVVPTVTVASTVAATTVVVSTVTVAPTTVIIIPASAASSASRRSTGEIVSNRRRSPRVVASSQKLSQINFFTLGCVNVSGQQQQSEDGGAGGREVGFGVCVGCVGRGGCWVGEGEGVWWVVDIPSCFLYVMKKLRVEFFIQS